MGGAASIEQTPYDETKFLQSKAIMESAVDDAEKFLKLKSIWTDSVPSDEDEARKVEAHMDTDGDHTAGELHHKEEQETGHSHEDCDQESREHQMKEPYHREGESHSMHDEHHEDIQRQPVQGLESSAETIGGLIEALTDSPRNPIEVHSEKVAQEVESLMTG